MELQALSAPSLCSGDSRHSPTTSLVAELHILAVLSSDCVQTEAPSAEKPVAYLRILAVLSSSVAAIGLVTALSLAAASTGPLTAAALILAAAAAGSLAALDWLLWPLANLARVLARSAERCSAVSEASSDLAVADDVPEPIRAYVLGQPPRPRGGRYN